jgi:hypothetical protein
MVRHDAVHDAVMFSETLIMVTSRGMPPFMMRW